MIGTAWNQINAATLQALCDDGEPESPTLDFKRAAPQKQRDDPSNEFAKDVCAFANAGGGDLVYGVASREDCADTLVPITDETADACKRRLSEVLANHVEPRIAGVRFKEVDLDEHGFALIVRVPRSFEAPHRYRVRSGGGVAAHHRFVTRSDTGTIDMDYAQLRDSFGRTATLADKARAFRADRLAQMTERGWFLGGLALGPKLCVHLVPLAGMARSGPLIDVAEIYHRHDIDFARAGGFVPQKQTNPDGLLMRGPSAHDAGQSDWLVRLFRTGAIEYLEQIGGQDGQDDARAAFIPAVRSSSAVRRTCAQLLAHARALGLQGPAILGLAGIGVARHPFRIMRNGVAFGGSLADREHVVLADQWIDDLADPGDLDLAIRPMLDEYWQCFGEVRCDCYDAAGTWCQTA